VDRLLALLDAFDGPELTLAEIADRSRLPLTTAHRLLAALQNWGGVQRGPGGRYRIGVHLWEVSARASTATTLREIALPALQDLYQATGTNVQLAVLDGHSALVIERLTGTCAVPTRTEVGGRLPLHATAVGKVLLAHAGPDLRRELLAGGLRRYTPRTVVMPGRLAASLAVVRDTGLGVCREEMTRGAASAATGVTDADGAVRAAVGVVAHAHRDLDRHVPALRAAAREISRRVAALDSAFFPGLERFDRWRIPT